MNTVVHKFITTKITEHLYQAALKSLAGGVVRPNWQLFVKIILVTVTFLLWQC